MRFSAAPAASNRVTDEIPAFKHMRAQMPRVVWAQLTDEQRNIPKMVLEMMGGDGEEWSVSPN